MGMTDDQDEEDRRPLNRSRYSDQGQYEARERQRTNSAHEAQPRDTRPHNPNFTKYHSYQDTSRSRNPFEEPTETGDDRDRRGNRTTEGKFGEWAGPNARTAKQTEDPFR